MALKPCRECGREISTAAKQCPHCGAPSSAEAVGKFMQSCGCILTLVVTIPILILLFLL